MAVECTVRTHKTFPIVPRLTLESCFNLPKNYGLRNRPGLGPKSNILLITLLFEAPCMSGTSPQNVERGYRVVLLTVP